MSYFGIMFLLQAMCVLHVLRTGRNYIWILLIVLVPMLGVLIYFIAEILPDIAGGARRQGASRNSGKSLIPGRALRDAERRVAMAETAENKANLADAYLAVGRAAEAVDLLRGSLQGVHAGDPTLLLALARAHFAQSEFDKTQLVLEELFRTNPGYKAPSADLLYASCLEAQGKTEAALRQYEAVVPGFPGQEARYRYAMLLQKAGRGEEARRLFQDICQSVEFAPRYARGAQREWYRLARRQLKD